MKLTQKLTFGFVGIALLVGVLVTTALYYQNEFIENYILHKTNDTEKTFQDLKKHEERKLASALEVFAQDKTFKNVFLEKNREKLYNYGQPLFQDLKQKYAITHTYFILPDQHCFVRLHNKDVYGDLITRFTFYKARDTKKTASGIELGKTAFVLRVVMPYYSSNELIGYVEFGEEIDHFLEILKGDTNNEFVIIADKEYLDREKWRLVRQTAGLRDNWDDLKDHVLVGDTTKGQIKKITTQYFTEENSELAEQGKTFFRQVQAEEKTFAFGGFKIIDAGGRQAGAVLCLIDITEQIGIAQRSYFATFGIAITIILITLGGGSLFSRSISRPIIKLKNAAIEISKGNMGIKVGITSKDEIGILADSFNKMTEDLQNTMNDLNQEVLEHKRAEEQLKKKTSELSKTQKATLSMAEDIETENAERKRAEKKLETAMHKAEAANTAKSHFLANMSHEIRTPMNAIMGYSDLLADEGLTDEQLNYVNIICNSGKHLLQVIDDILDFSKIEAGKLNIEKQDCSLKELLTTIGSMTVPLMAEKNLEFKIREDSGLPANIHTDMARLQQCLINIVNNAIKFTKEGHVHLNVSLEDKNNDPYIRFDVEDTGIGIPQERQNAIFESFTQADGGTSRKYGGTGLGLTITKQLTELLGGELTLTSQEGAGSTFSIVIPTGLDITNQPLLDRCSIEDHTKITKERSDQPEFSGHVLVAEDVRTNQMLIKTLLKRMGLEVTIAKDGQEALQMALADKFDLILMDIQMPNMNGYDAAGELRKQGLTTPIIALTANAMKGDDKKCIDAGCDDYLAKPINRNDLIEKLNKYLPAKINT